MAGSRSPLDQGPDYYDRQAEQAERFAERLAPAAAGKFRKLAEEWRRRAGASSGKPSA